MEKTIKIYGCDLCGKESQEKNDFKKVRLNVIWTTEQSEGKNCKPYIDDEKLLLCQGCMDRIASSLIVKAYREHGDNQFEFIEPQDYKNIKWTEK